MLPAVHLAGPTPAPDTPRGLALLGSTGSIGAQALDIVRLFPDRFRVRVLSAKTRVDLLLPQILEFQPAFAVIGDTERAAWLRQHLDGHPTRILVGDAGLSESVQRDDVDLVLTAVVGFSGLSPTQAAIHAGKTIALANKETLVVAGELVRDWTRTHGTTILPVDSEHSALFQSLLGEPPEAIEKLILTASGGPFRTRPRDTFAAITPAEALKHPNWTMGAKITIDSATMMNKGLEVIEARWMFDVPVEKIEVLVHPQSIIHSMVALAVGCTRAQLGAPDMKVPIQYALSFPDRWPAPHPRIDWTTLPRLDFEPPDVARFPCLRLAFDALAVGGTAPAVLNAANEVAVQLFLDGHIGFLDIPHLIERTLEWEARPLATPSVEALVEADALARTRVLELSRTSAGVLR